MDLELLRAFVAVAESRSFTQAGTRLHRTQSTVSQQIGRLEAYLDAPLFDRDTRRVTLTEAGERYIAYARRLLAVDEEARAALRAGTGAVFLHVGVPEDFAVLRLPEVLAEFAAAHPAARLEVVAAPSGDLLARFESGMLDVAVIKATAPPPDALTCWREPLSWVVGPGSEAFRQRPVPLIAYPQGCSYRARATEALDTADTGWRIAYESPNWSGIRAAVESGFGVALLAEADRIPDVRRLGAAEGFPPVAPTFLSVRARQTPPPAAAADLIDAIARLIPEDRRAAAPLVA